MAEDRGSWADRLERGARWAVPILIGLMAVHGVWAARGLFADGSWYLLNILSTDTFLDFDPARWFAPIVTQAPLLAASHLGVTDIAALIRIQSLGLIAIPLAIWVGALAAQWRKPAYWAFVVMFAVVQLNSGFMAVGEYLLAYALVALSAAILLREEALRRWQLAVLVPSAVVLLLSYEALAHLGPVLAVIAVARLVGVRGMGPAGPRGTRVVIVVLAVLYACAAALAIRSILHPRDAYNAANAADLLTPLRQDGQFVISAVIAVLVVAIPLIRRGSWATALSVALAAASMVLALPAVWAAPALHYSARTLAGLALFGLLCGVVLVQVVTARRAQDGAQLAHPARLAWIAPLALLCAQVVPFTVHTAGFASWTADFEQVVVSGSGTVPIAASGLDPEATALYGWSWTNPTVSILLRENRGQGTVLSMPADAAASARWMPDPLPEPLPKFVKGTRLFP